MNTPGGNAVSVAEHTLALMLAMARHIPQASASTRAGKWEKKRLMGRWPQSLALKKIYLNNFIVFSIIIQGEDDDEDPALGIQVGPGSDAKPSIPPKPMQITR